MNKILARKAIYLTFRHHPYDYYMPLVSALYYIVRRDGSASGLQNLVGDSVRDLWQDQGIENLFGLKLELSRHFSPYHFLCFQLVMPRLYGNLVRITNLGNYPQIPLAEFKAMVDSYNANTSSRVTIFSGNWNAVTEPPELTALYFHNL